MKETNTYEVITKFNKDLIIQEAGFSGSELIPDMTRNVIQLQEQGVREALIKLGWTAPEESTDLQSQSDELRAHACMLKTALALCSAQHKEHYIGQAVVDAALEASPAQSLADTRAEAVMDAAKHIKEEVIANETYYTVVAGRPLVPTSMIENYANKIKGGE